METAIVAIFWGLQSPGAFDDDRAERGFSHPSRLWLSVCPDNPAAASCLDRVVVCSLVDVSGFLYLMILN